MHACISSQIRRFAIRSLLTCAATIAPIVADAGDVDYGSQFATPAVASTPCDFELYGSEELCGWGNVCPLATHDSGVLPTPAAPKSSKDLSTTAIVAAALASAGVSVEQIVEPFAMVGPYLDNSVEMVKDFQGWWETTLAQAESMKTATDAIQDDLDRIAAEEPVDVENLGPSVVVDMPPTKQAVTESVSIQITAIDALIGSSPIIATIQDDYLPYDLSARDLKLWSVFPTSTHPFCVRSHMEELNQSPMWDDFDQAVGADTGVAPILETAAVTGSADCLLDEFIWQFASWTAEDSPIWSLLSPRSIGRRFAAIAADGNRFVQNAAQLLASNWPEAKSEDQPSSTGAALLARAGAVRASEPVAPISAAEVLIAELPSGTNLR